MTNWQSDLEAFIAETKAFVERVGAKHRLADEYDAAQERGEVRGASNQHTAASSPEVAAIADIGLTHKDIHEARIIRDAEKADPGIVRRTLDEKLALGEEPTKASRRQIVADPNRARDEILQRVANFRAHQERFTREREDFAAAELRRMWAR
jgi:hypothetical protein